MSNMIIDQAEIDALLSAASDLAAEANAELPSPAAGPSATPARFASRPASSMAAVSPHLARVLKLRVPLIVRLAQRAMSVSSVCDLSVGSIIEFEKSVEEPLSLLVNNRLVGQGACVKIGENFGLRVTQICNPTQRILSMGGT